MVLRTFTHAGLLNKSHANAHACCLNSATSSDLTASLAAGAKQQGVRIFEKSRVSGIHIEQGRIKGVETDRGFVQCEIVVNCGGQWARKIGQMAGVAVPLHSAEHYYIVTKVTAALICCASTTAAQLARVPIDATYCLSCTVVLRCVMRVKLPREQPLKPSVSPMLPIMRVSAISSQPNSTSKLCTLAHFASYVSLPLCCVGS